jgi:hypothetical protein
VAGVESCGARFVSRGFAKPPPRPHNPSGTCCSAGPYLVKLLDEGKIPFRAVGKYRRVRFADLMACKQADDAARSKIADQLTAEAQELGMGY